MKRFCFLFLSLMLATPTLATWGTNCTNNGGTIITANSYGNDKGGFCHDPNDSSLTNNCNGKSFCRSIAYLNFWSAFNWCDGIGGKLASFESMCPGSQTYTNERRGTCPNLVGLKDSWHWTSIGWGTSNSLQVNLSTGGIRSFNRAGAYGDFFVLCEEK